MAILTIYLVVDHWHKDQSKSKKVSKDLSAISATLIKNGSTTKIIFTDKNVEAIQKDGREIWTSVRPEKIIDQWIPKLDELKIPYSYSSDSWLNKNFVTLLLLVILIVLPSLLRNNGKFRFQRKDKMAIQSDTTFDDVAGCDEVIEELREATEWLKNPKAYNVVGARIPRGVLLVGPPGTGKTLLARAVSGQANVPFFSTSGPEFIEVYVGIGASRVREIFRMARKNAPCVVFIDEIDGIGRRRIEGDISGGDQEASQTLTQLLTELDGFIKEDKPILVLAATNRPENLDPALLRPGRFTRILNVDPPDMRGRVAILKVHASKYTIDETVDMEAVAKLTPLGFTGADLDNLINEAAVLAARDRNTKITTDHLAKALERVMAGIAKKNRQLRPDDKKRVAVHEAGHAIVRSALGLGEEVHRVSVIPRGQALGATMQVPPDDRFLMTKRELEVDIICMLAGREAELLVTEDSSSGSSSDLEKASKWAWSMVAHFGMGSTAIGLLSKNEKVDDNSYYSEDTLRVMECEVRQILDHLSQRAKKLLTTNEELVIQMSTLLNDREELSGEELRQLLARVVKCESTLINQ